MSRFASQVQVFWDDSCAQDQHSIGEDHNDSAKVLLNQVFDQPSSGDPNNFKSINFYSYEPAVVSMDGLCRILYCVLASVSFDTSSTTSQGCTRINHHDDLASECLMMM